jgi:hypothetical protein
MRTQNPPPLKACRFDSDVGHQLETLLQIIRLGAESAGIRTVIHSALCVLQFIDSVRGATNCTFDQYTQ